MKGGRAIAAGAVVAVAVAVSVAVYAGGDNDTGAKSVVRVGYFPVVGHAIPIVGIERGIFQEHMPDVMVDAKVFDSGPQVIESMFAGSIDIAYVGPGPAINAFLNSEDGGVRVLSGAASGGTSFVMHPDAASPEFDFAHKMIAAPQIGNTQDVSLRHYIAERGLHSADRGGSVTIYNIPNPDIVTLFVKGEIDGAWVSEPWATILVDEYGGVRLFQEETLWPDGEFATVLLVADMAYAEANPGIIRAWLDAHEESARVINSDKDAAGVMFNEFLLNHFGQQLGDGVVRTAIYNTKVTVDPLSDTVYEFADRAEALGYMGRGSHDLSGLFAFGNSNASATLGAGSVIVGAVAVQTGTTAVPSATADMRGERPESVVNHTLTAASLMSTAMTDITTTTEATVPLLEA